MPNSTNTGTGTITPTDAGVMCLGMLKADEWKPPTKISAVLEFARQLLREPNPDDAVEGRIAEELRRDRSIWEIQARDWTRRYAMKK
jgi:ubiquitin-protein ligase